LFLCLTVKDRYGDVDNLDEDDDESSDETEDEDAKVDPFLNPIFPNQNFNFEFFSTTGIDRGR
jgi:hypothetical protein